MMLLFASAIYFGWLWHNRGAVDYRQTLDSIQIQERVKRREVLRRRLFKKPDGNSNEPPLFVPSRTTKKELGTVP